MNRIKQLIIISIISQFLVTQIYSNSCPGPVVLVIGTRPEAIKMIPVYQALQEKGIPSLICSTGQHTDLLDDLFELFKVTPHRSLHIMIPGQDLFHITTSVLNKMKDYFNEVKPSLILVQGDTTTAMAAALAAFYLRIPVGHVEAGLRTFNVYAPYPEEMNRQFISIIATYHFAPTSLSVENLMHEYRDEESIFCVGNTVVDALHIVSRAIENKTLSVSQEVQNIVQECKTKNKKIILLTAHRRESFKEGIRNIFSAIKELLETNPNLFVIYPMHPNPIIKEIFEESGLKEIPNIWVSKPLIYNDLVYLLNAVDLVATDSGGIQEEAISLGKRTFVLRNETDRPEGVICGIAQLVGTDEHQIFSSINAALHETCVYSNCMVYGDGTSASKIAQLIQTKIYNNTIQKDPR